MAKAKSYIDVSKKSQVVIINPTKKSQKQARIRVRTEFCAFEKVHSFKSTLIILSKVKR